MRKDTKKELLDVTKRFLHVKNLIIAEGIEKGLRSNERIFADTLEESQQNIAKIRPNVRNVSLSIVKKLCKVHKVSPNYMILGIGSEFMDKETQTLEKRIEAIERKLKIK